ncbi:MAG: cytochrome c family protein [Planctomycetes bacterium]|nr:cytochrome c family protein [Planctomycetota bacterium]
MLRSFLAVVTAVLLGLPLAAAEVLPLFQRIELGPTETASVTLTVTALAGARVTAVATDCACLRCETALPATVPDGGTVALRLRASGVRPGVEEATVHTTAGTFTARIQIVGPGAGDGLTTLTTALADAGSQRWALWGIVHHLNGQVRNCGCSQGSLGGAGILAALPAQAARIAPTSTTRWLLTGEVDGPKPGLGAALTQRGWTVNDPAVVVTVDPMTMLANPALVAVIPATPLSVEHRKILRPVLAGGLTVELLLIDDQRQIRSRRILPVDRTLADDPAFVARFPDPLTKVVTTVQPSESCRECHAATVDHWAGTRHALAYARLPEADRTDTCITCHTLPLAGKAVAPGVHCQSCHSGTEAHIAGRGMTRTTGAVDCRSCHDARHHPGFDRARLWEVIRHGR